MKALTSTQLAIIAIVAIAVVTIGAATVMKLDPREVGTNAVSGLLGFLTGGAVAAKVANVNKTPDLAPPQPTPPFAGRGGRRSESMMSLEERDA